MASNNSAFLKHSHYRSNGSGRDMYIYADNGGYLKRVFTSKFDPMGFHQVSRSVVTLPSITGKTIHYGPDGSGRDMYIKTDDGGNLPTLGDISPRRNEFINSLRFYQQEQKRIGSRDYFRMSQLKLPIKETLKIREKVKILKALTSRLTSTHQCKESKLPAIRMEK